MPRKEIENDEINRILDSLNAQQIGETEYYHGRVAHGQPRWKDYQIPQSEEEIHVYFPHEYYGGGLIGKNPNLIYSSSLKPVIEKLIVEQNKG